MIRTIVFDLGNVLLYFSHERMRQQVCQLCECSLADIQPLLDPYNGLFDQFERGQLSLREFHQQVEAVLQKTIVFQDLMNAVSDIFWLNTSMRPILRAIRERGTRLVMLSNTNAAHIEFAKRHFDLFDEFDAEVFSYEVKAVKPEKAIFDALLETIQCEPDQCFYTDDTPGHVQAALQLGIPSGVFTDARTFLAQLREQGYDLSMGETK
ncbi:HAD family hydrolase [Thalassoroseus pseudoceratinae]|uniref:HAD family hydrolase n=1 Tax=Thalassoroseus pseudoceratinae TaxID=2713176 RepID=UPI001420AD51|nr:HAD family phosphatase [Thalassoroseus pseudoceratinae]